jgi:cytidylate kinase
MKFPVPHEVLEKVLHRYEQERGAEQEAAEATRVPRVITISRICGSGGKSIATMVGERLGWPVWDSQILNLLADQSHGHYQARMFEALDERTQGAVEENVLGCLGELDHHTYLYLLGKALCIIAQRDAIIVGRAADIMLPGSLRVRIKASTTARINRMMERWKLSDSETAKKIGVVDRERVGFRKEFARCLGKARKVEEYTFDLEIVTDRISLAAGAEAVVAAARSFFNLA